MALRYPLTIGCFKTTGDGSKVFFPWGWWGRGYLISSDKDFERLYEQMSGWLAGLLLVWIFTGMAILIFGTPPTCILRDSAVETFFAKFWSSVLADGWMTLSMCVISAVSFFGAFAGWVRFQCRRLLPTEEKLTPAEWAANGASDSGYLPCLFVIAGLAFILISIYAIVRRPESFLYVVVMNSCWVFFAVANARILIEKRHRASCPS